MGPRVTVMVSEIQRLEENQGALFYFIFFLSLQFWSSLIVASSSDCPGEYCSCVSLHCNGMGFFCSVRVVMGQAVRGYEFFHISF